MALLSAICLLLHAWQAEPVPAPTTTPVPSPTPTQPTQPTPEQDPRSPFHLGLGLGPSWRLGETKQGSARAQGYALPIALTYRYGQAGRLLELAAGFQFSHEVFWKCASWGNLLPWSSGGSCLGQTLVRHGDFMAVQTGTLRLGAWRPRATLAAGLTLAQLLMPDSTDRATAQATRPVVRLALGLERELTGELALAVELAHTVMLVSPRRIVDGRSRPLFSDRQALSFWVIYTPDLGK